MPDSPDAVEEFPQKEDPTQNLERIQEAFLHARSVLIRIGYGGGNGRELVEEAKLALDVLRKMGF